MQPNIEFTADGALIQGHPTLEQWGDAFTRALSLGVVATWARTDLTVFAEDENPFGDEHYQYFSAARISEGTRNNDLRRGRRFPYGHDLRRFEHDLSPSHYDAVAVLDDTDAEIVLTEAAETGMGREWVRGKVKEILNSPDPLRQPVTLLVDGAGVVSVTLALPMWTWGKQFDVILKEKAA